MRASKREHRDRVNRLRELPQFAHCTDDQMRQIDALGAEIAIDAGAVLRNAATGRSLFIVRSGRVAITGNAIHALTSVRLLVFDPAETELVMRALSREADLDQLLTLTPAPSPRTPRHVTPADVSA